jgi:hypothetical protein
MRARHFPFSLLVKDLLVLLSTGGDGTKLGDIDEGLHEGILLTG